MGKPPDPVPAELATVLHTALQSPTMRFSAGPLCAKPFVGVSPPTQAFPHPIPKRKHPYTPFTYEEVEGSEGLKP